MKLPPVAILAGGLATRLRPITESTPKSLVPVAGDPFLAHQLRLLRAQGIERVVLCVGHLGGRVAEAFGDGADYGVALDYSFDGPALLGTGGAILKALPKLGDTFFVLYGDSYLPCAFPPVAAHFAGCGKPALMTVYRNDDRHDASNVVFRDGEIAVYSKREKLPEMRHIDYGLSLFRAGVFRGRPAGKFDLADLMAELVAARLLAGFEVRERFYEIGSHAGLAELEGLLSTGDSGKNAP